MTVRGFAEHLGVAARTVAKWEAGRAGIQPLPETQSILDSALRCASEEDRQRFDAILTSPQSGEAPESRPFGLLAVADMPLLPAFEPRAQEDPDVQRREFIATAIAAAGLPFYDAPGTLAESGRPIAPHVRTVGRGDLDAVREMASIFSRVDQRRGGGHARSAVVQYLNADVSAYLRGTYADERVRSAMFSAASELAYLSGWMAFDDAEHSTARRHLDVALRLAMEADDRPLAGHILRAMAHQAIDLGQYQHGLELATASVNRNIMDPASPRERALLGVVYARSLGMAGQQPAAAAALTQAEDHLAAAAPGDDEPARVFFFGEASLAHETARTLHQIGDLPGAIREFRRSVTKREVATFTRTHAVTLGYLGAAQADAGELDEACSTWSRALDAADGVKSGRVRQVVIEMRSALSPHRRRGNATLKELDSRAAVYLAPTQT
jgi:tetratricopeptide (TPR) repeat protein